MRAFLRIMAGLALAAISLVVAHQFGWLSGNRRAAPAATEAALIVDTNAPSPSRSPVQAVTTPAATPLFPDSPALVQTNPVPAPLMERIRWEQGIDDILVAESESAQKAQRLLELYPTLPEAGQVEAAQHLANLMPSTNLTAVASLITNTLTPPGVIDVLVADLLNRPNRVKLPLMLEVARTPGHPWRDEARQMLELYVQKDYGDDWGAWGQAVQTWLNENPE